MCPLNVKGTETAIDLVLSRIYLILIAVRIYCKYQFGYESLTSKYGNASPRTCHPFNLILITLLI